MHMTKFLCNEKTIFLVAAKIARYDRTLYDKCLGALVVKLRCFVRRIFRVCGSFFFWGGGWREDLLKISALEGSS